MGHAKNSNSAIERLLAKGLINPPKYVAGGTQYETIMGSMAYHVSSDSSDMDIYGWCMPPKDMAFPHLQGEIEGFGKPRDRFWQWSEHHIKDVEKSREYDLTVYNVAKYFNLCMENNPNMIDSLFTPENCVLKATKLAQNVRDHRRIFLHKGCWHKFRGYAYTQMQQMNVKQPLESSKRYESWKKHGYDVKFAYHIVRLLGEVEQILLEGDLDLTRDNERLKAIRRGEWTVEQIKQFFTDKARSLDEAHAKSLLPEVARETEIRRLLLETMEEYYGNLDHVVARPDEYKDLLIQIKKITDKI